MGVAKILGPFLCMFVLTNLVVQSDLLMTSGRMDVFRNTDENWYGIVLTRLESQGCDQGLPVTFRFADRPNFHSCAFLKLLNAVSPFREAHAKTLFLKMSARALFLLLSALIGFAVLQPAGVRHGWASGLLVGAWYFADPGLSQFKPVLLVASEWLHGDWTALSHPSRYVSPLHYWLPILGALASFLVFIERDLLTASPAGALRLGVLSIGGAVVGLLCMSLTPFYAWLPGLYVLGLVLVLGWHRRPRSEVALLALLVCGGGVMALLQSRKASSIPFRDEVLLRSSFLQGYFAPIFVAHKGLIATALVLAAMIAALPGRHRRIGIATGAGLYGLVNINVVTGIEFQNFHFKDYLGPLAWGAIFLLAVRATQRVRIAVWTVAFIACVIGFGYRAVSMRRAPTGFAALERHPDAAALEAHARASGSGRRYYCGSWYPLLAAFTEARCSYHHLLMTYPLSDEELLDETISYYKLSGMEDAEMERLIFAEAVEERAMSTWRFGIRPQWVAGIPSHERYSKNENRMRLARLWMEEYRKYPRSKLEAAARDFDFLILKKPAARLMPLLAPVEEFSEYGIYKVVAPSEATEGRAARSETSRSRSLSAGNSTR